MKSIVLKNNLKDGLAIIEHALSDGGNLPILKNILAIAKDGEIELRATNLEIAVTTKISAKIISNGDFCVSGGLFISLINQIPTERLELSVTNNTLLIHSDNNDLELPLSSTEDFPIIPKIEKEVIKVRITGTKLKNIIDKIILSVGHSEIRPELSGVYIKINAEEIVFTGTDIFRLAEYRLREVNKIEGLDDGSFECIAPLKTIQEISRIFNKEEDVECIFSTQEFFIKTKNSEMISRLINSKFPDYEGMKIIPDTYETEIEIEKEELIKSIKIIQVLSSLNGEVELKNNGESILEIKSTEKSLGKSHSLIPAKIKGKDTNCVLNIRYFLDGLKSVSEKNVKIWLNGKEKPALIFNEGTPYLYLVMPVRK